MKRFILTIVLLVLFVSDSFATTTVVTRTTKGSTLTWSELDSNFTTLRDAHDNYVALSASQIASLLLGQSGGTLGFTTKAAMDADLAHPAGTLALVTNDTTTTNNVYWIKLGASGAGSWQKSSIAPVLPFADVRIYSDFSNAVTTQGSTPGILINSESESVSTSMSTPSTLQVWNIPGGDLVVATGQTLTLDGGMQNDGVISGAGNVIINGVYSGKGTITVTGTVTVNGNLNIGRQTVFPNSSRVTYNKNVSVIYPEWRGVVVGTAGKGRTVNDPAMKATMLDVAASGGGHIEFGPGIYYLKDLMVDFSNAIVSGQGAATILQNDPNWDGETEGWGHFVSAIGKITRTDLGGVMIKYYNDGLEASATVPISNIIFRDFKVVWNDTECASYPTGSALLAMNGVGVLNASNVLFENIVVDMGTRQKAFFIAGMYNNTITEHIIFRNLVATNTRWGLQINNNPTDVTTTVMGDITIDNCKFTLIDNRTTYREQYGIAMQSQNEVGNLKILNNTIIGGRVGIFIGRAESLVYPTSPVVIEKNYVKDFWEVGIYVQSNDPRILNNIIESEVLVYDITPTPPAPNAVDGFQLAGIATSSYSYDYKGPKSTLIQGNVFRNLYASAWDTTHYVSAIRITPSMNTSVVQIIGNDFQYPSKAPYRDVYSYAVPRNYGSIYLAGNKFSKSANNTTTATILSAGTGYTNGTYTNQTPLGGSGSGLKINYTVAGGVVTAVSVYSPSSGIYTFGYGYNNDDVMAITGGNGDARFRLVTYRLAVSGASYPVVDGGGNQGLTLAVNTTLSTGSTSPQNTTVTTAGTGYTTTADIYPTAYMEIVGGVDGVGGYFSGTANPYTVVTGSDTATAYNLANFDERIIPGANFTMYIGSTLYYCTQTGTLNNHTLTFNAYSDSTRTTPVTGELGTDVTFSYSVGSGLRGDMVAAAGAVTSFTVDTLGVGYWYGDILHIPGGNGDARVTYNIIRHYFPKGYMFWNNNPSVDAKGMILQGWINTLAGYGGIWTPSYTSNTTPVTP